MAYGFNLIEIFVRNSDSDTLLSKGVTFPE